MRKSAGPPVAFSNLDRDGQAHTDSRLSDMDRLPTSKQVAFGGEARAHQTARPFRRIVLP